MDRSNTTIAVLGLGYIGLPTSLEFANAGFRVIGVDINSEAVAKLNEGRIHIHEEGLQQWYESVRASGRFRATTQIEPADVFLICVPTPILEDKRADLGAVRKATEAIATVLKPGNLVVLVSTSPPRTCLDVIAPILEAKCGLVSGRDYMLAHCPERVIPGAILKELRENHRVVGGTTPEATEQVYQLYASFVPEDRLHKTDATTAEMVKLMENTFRDVNIALANEMAKVCEHLGIEPRQALRLASLHPRVKYLSPGIGVGGHCIPVDPWFIIEKAPELTPVMRAARGVNDSRPHEVASQIMLTAADGQKIALLGLAFKPNVDDLRESPAVEVAQLVLRQRGQVMIVEPFVDELPEEVASAELVSLDVATSQADLLVCLVAHDAFADLPPRDDQTRLDFVGRWAPAKG